MTILAGNGPSVSSSKIFPVMPGNELEVTIGFVEKVSLPVCANRKILNSKLPVSNVILSTTTIIFIVRTKIGDSTCEQVKRILTICRLHFQKFDFRKPSFINKESLSLI